MKVSQTVSWDNRILWSEGTFLQPQHFQQHDRYLDAQLERVRGPCARTDADSSRSRSTSRCSSSASWRSGRARGVLPDGTPFDCPARDPLPLPLDVPATLRESLVTLALPVRRPGVDEADLGGAGADSLARYAAGELEVKDSNASFDRTALIQIGRLRLQLLKEADVTAAYSGLGVARVIERRADNRVMLDRGYIPPMLDAGADAHAVGHLRDVHGLLHQRGDALATRLSQPGPGGIAEIADFLWLETINRFEPLFAHLAATAPLHPERLYAECLPLAGELSTLHPRESATRRLSRLSPRRPRRVVRPVIADIRRSLSMVLERNAIPIELHERGYGLRVAAIPDSDLLKTARFVLAAKAQLPSERLQASLPTLVKIGPVERIRDLVNLNLPGIALAQPAGGAAADSLPRGLPLLRAGRERRSLEE